MFAGVCLFFNFTNVLPTWKLYSLHSVDPLSLDGLNFILLISSLNIGHRMAQLKSLQRNFQEPFLLAVESEKLLLYFSHIQFFEIRFTVNITDYIIK